MYLDEDVRPQSAEQVAGKFASITRTQKLTIDFVRYLPIGERQNYQVSDYPEVLYEW